MDDLGLRDLVNLEDWQKIQDYFSDVMEISLKTISVDGKSLTNTSRPSRICTEILSKVPSYSGFCVDKVLGNDETKKPLGINEITNFHCPFGLESFAIPIRAVGKSIISYVVVGPSILRARKDAAEYTREAQRLGLSADDVIDALIEINVFSHNKIYSITRLIENIFSYMAQTGYHKKRLGEIAPEVIELDPLFSRYYEEKILNALLNSCTIALGADSGSVMTLDKKTNMLHIKVASRLDEQIVNNTNIKVGEGIAGVAAALAKPIILPKDRKKSGLSEKMKRRYIKSSMIVPFNKGTDPSNVYGVINLNIVRRRVDFSEKDIALVKELVNLAGIALAPFQL